MMNWLLVGYMWLFVHRPFEVWTWLGVLHFERIYMLFTIAVWLLGSGGKRQFGNIFTLMLLFYTLAITTATLFSPYQSFLDNGDWQNWIKYIIFYVIFVTSVKTEKDLKFVVTGFIVACFLFMGHSYREFLNGNVAFAAGVVRLVGVGVTFSEFNDYGTSLVCFLPMLLPLITLCKRKWHYLFAIVYFLLTARSVMLTGSRTAFIMMLGLMILPVLFSRHRFKLIPLFLVLAPIGWLVMPESLQNRYRTLWDPTISEQANANMQGRTRGFYDGMTNWSNNPIFGVGPGCHGMATGSGMEAHNLPGQVAGETGTLGVIAFLSMFVCFGINHWNIRKNYQFLREKNREKEGKYCWIVSTAVMYATFMVLLQGAGLHNAYRFYWVWFGAFQVLAAMIIQEKADAAQKQTVSVPKRPIGSVLPRFRTIS